MKKLLVALLSVAFILSCGGRTSVKAPKTQTSADSMSYVMGLNLGRNLIGMDSLLNVDMVCEGLRDAYAGIPKLNDEEARAAYLKYMNYDIYERVQRFETQFLADLRRQDRKFVATHTGLTYKIAEIGDMKNVVRNNRDTIRLRYRALDQAGNIVDTAYYRGDTLRLAVGNMTRGMIEATKLIGKGGHMEAWLPSSLAFGSAGCDSLNVEPNTMLYYELWLIDIERR